MPIFRITWRRALRNVFRATAVAAVLLTGGITALYLYVSWGLPSVSALTSAKGLNAALGQYVQPPPQVFLLPLDAAPPHVVGAFIATHGRGFANRNFPGGGLFARDLSRLLLRARGEKYSLVQAAVLQCNIALFLSREDILSAWLATAYFGRGVWGISAAARYYCDKPLAELNICDAALLATLPFGHPVHAKERQQFVLRAMAKLGLASDTDLAGCK
jgi:membrane peptidoglycan carboxypeptidase